jgi:hypothetical protein
MEAEVSFKTLVTVNKSIQNSATKECNLTIYCHHNPMYLMYKHSFCIQERCVILFIVGLVCFPCLLLLLCLLDLIAAILDCRKNNFRMGFGSLQVV